MLQDFWESIPLWVVVVVAVLLLGALYVLFVPVLGLPMWMYLLVFGGIAVGGIVGAIRGMLGGGI